MPVPDILKINEIFWSFQGEGCRFGYPSLFLRLSGCSLRCSYCDTPQSWQVDGREMTLGAIMEQIDALLSSHPRSQLVITGGEPLEQDLGPLLTCLVSRGLFVAIETNGTCFQDVPVNWWTVAPKRESAYFIHPQLIKRVHELKLVVTEDLEPEIIRRIGETVPGVPIFLQPDLYNQGPDAYRRTAALFHRAVAEGVGELRVGMQLHRIYGVP